MRRNKVLTTLAAVSMSAMMAVSAVPATTVLAANTQNEQASVVELNANNVKIADTTYGSAPVVKLTNGTTLKEGTDFTFEQNGKTVKGTDLAKLDAGQTVSVDVIANTDGNYSGTVQNVTYTIGKANLNLSVSVKPGKKEGRAYTEYTPVINGVPKDFTGTTELKLIKDGVPVGDYTNKSIAGTKGSYKLELRTKGDKNYNAVGYDAKGNEIATNATAEFTIDEEDNVNKKLNIKLNDSTYGATPTIEFLDNEDSDTLNDEPRKITVDVYSVKTEPVDAKDPSKGEKVTLVNGKPVKAEKVATTVVKNDTDTTTKVAAIKNVAKTEDLLDAGTYLVDVFATDEEGNYNLAKGELRDQVVKVNKLNLNSLKLAKASEPFKGYSYDLSQGTSVDAKYGVTLNNGKVTFGNLATVPTSEYTFSAEGTNVSKVGDTYYGTHAGKYTLKATAKPTSKNFTGSVTTDFTITGSRAQNVYLDAVDTIYNHEAYKGASAKASTKVTLSYYKYDATKENHAGEALASAPTDAGRYVVRAYTPGDDNYRAAEAYKDFTIGQATVASVTYNPERDYDGTATMPELVIKDQYGKVVSSDNYDFTHVADYTNDDGKDAVKHQGTLTLKKNYKNVGALEGKDGNYTVNADAKADKYTLGYTIKPYDLLNSKDATRVVVDDGVVGETPEVHVYAINGNEIPTTDYKVTASNNTKVGTGNVNIAGVPNGHVYSDGRKIQNVTNSVSQKYNVVKAAEKTVNMYRVYNPNSGEHFFTVSAGEKNHLVSLGWRDEGVAWKTPKTGTPVYRVYNAKGGEHHYTVSQAEVKNLVAHGWTDEGIGWYSAKKTDKGAKAVYRVYNKNAFANNHHYTTSKGEAKSLINLGWRDEGVAFYEF